MSRRKAAIKRGLLKGKRVSYAPTNRIEDYAALAREFMTCVFELDPDATYIVYCDTGRRSRAATFLLHERGIQALSLAGGITHWPYEVVGTAV